MVSTRWSPLDGHALDGHELDAHALDDQVLDGRALESHALDSHTLEIYPIDQTSCENDQFWLFLDVTTFRIFQDNYFEGLTYFMLP